MKTSTLLLSFSLVVSAALPAAAQKPSKKDERSAATAPAKPARKLEVRHTGQASARASHRGAKGLDPNAGIKRKGFLSLQESRRDRSESMTELFVNAKHESARELGPHRPQHSSHIEASARPSASLHIEFDPSPLAFMDEEREKEKAAASERESKSRRAKDRGDRD